MEAVTVTHSVAFTARIDGETTDSGALCATKRFVTTMADGDVTDDDETPHRS